MPELLLLLLLPSSPPSICKLQWLVCRVKSCVLDLLARWFRVLARRVRVPHRWHDVAGPNEIGGPMVALIYRVAGVECCLSVLGELAEEGVGEQVETVESVVVVGLPDNGVHRNRIN